MPIKHQASCYRNRNGKRYENDGDICDYEFGSDLLQQAIRRVSQFRKFGKRAFYEKHPDGFYRVFVECGEK